MSFANRFRPARTRGLVRAVTLALALAVAGSVSSAPAAATAPVAGEAELRGVFVYNFLRFTQWPPGTFPAPGSPFVVVVVGDSELGATLERLLAGKSLDSHPFVVVPAGEPSTGATAHAVFIGPARHKDVGSVLRAVGSRPVLTISDSPSFVRQGGMIRLYPADRRLRFEISTRASSASRLVLSSRLLQLADNVVRR